MNQSKFFAKISQMQYASQWLVFACDFFLALLSTFLTVLLIVHLWNIENYDEFFSKAMAFSILSSTIGILSFKTYKGLIRHSSLTEAGRLASANLLRFILSLFLYIFLLENYPYWM